MYSKNRHTTDEIESYILMYLQENISFKELKEDYGLLINWTSFWNKVLRYQERCISDIQVRSKHNKYTEKFKLAVVKEYQKEKIHIGQLAVKYNIPNSDTVRS